MNKSNQDLNRLEKYEKLTAEVKGRIKNQTDNLRSRLDRMEKLLEKPTLR